MTSLYAQSVPVLVKYLHNLSAIVEKGRQFADEKGMKHEDLINFRLISDMRGLDYQVQFCCNMAKFLVARLGGGEQDVPVFADDERTLDELQARIARTVAILRAADPAGFEGKEGAEVVVATPMGSFGFSGQRYVSEYALPLFHFHLSTAYCILRHLGVPLGALDYLAGVLEKVEEKEEGEKEEEKKEEKKA